ncbi:LOW QUALITY PROTEIN: hypothetical protein PanWU01x14_114270 [Parasponia andersonii]|uniref:Uncharacterized protein n=1 Tax=Parasponia andersonii TaxID=3476 RepID=A0A2P5CXB6_PARAD|nr:LOW QUALITY PROTEIN: hypothetical protein PanWU01x14_114270 [Parasponia andersonii]
MGQTSLSTKNTRKIILLFKRGPKCRATQNSPFSIGQYQWVFIFIHTISYAFSRVAIECCSEFSFLSMYIPCQTTKSSSETLKEIKESQTPFRILLSNLIIVPIFFNKLTNVEPLDGSQWLWRRRFPISSFLSQSGFQIYVIERKKTFNQQNENNNNNNNNNNNKNIRKYQINSKDPLSIKLKWKFHFF